MEIEIKGEGFVWQGQASRELLSFLMLPKTEAEARAVFETAIVPFDAEQEKTRSAANGTGQRDFATESIGQRLVDYLKTNGPSTAKQCARILGLRIHSLGYQTRGLRREGALESYLVKGVTHYRLKAQG